MPCCCSGGRGSHCFTKRSGVKRKSQSDGGSGGMAERMGLARSLRHGSARASAAACEARRQTCAIAQTRVPMGLRANGLWGGGGGRCRDLRHMSVCRRPRARALCPGPLCRCAVRRGPRAVRSAPYPPAPPRGLTAPRPVRPPDPPLWTSADGVGRPGLSAIISRAPPGGCDSLALDTNYPPPPLTVGRRPPLGGGEGGGEGR